MADTNIEWCDKVWNPVRGCSRVSEGCRNCYAERQAYRFSGHPQWTGKIHLAEDKLDEPLRKRKPQRIFVNSQSDLFHEDVPFEFIDKVFAVMALCPQHTFIVLTKRPARMLEYLADQPSAIPDCIEFKGAIAGTHRALVAMLKDVPASVLNSAAKWQDEHYPHSDGFMRAWPLPNVWLGVSVEDQKTADDRIPLLLQTPAAVRWVSYEPALGTLSFRWSAWDNHAPNSRRLKQLPDVERGGKTIAGCVDHLDGLRLLDWVVCGGESGPGARPMHPDWARSVRDQCQSAGVPFFFKQWGEYIGGPIVKDGSFCGGAYVDAKGHTSIEYSHDFGDGVGAVRVGKKAAGRLLDGREWNEFPRVWEGAK